MNKGSTIYAETILLYLPVRRQLNREEAPESKRKYARPAPGKPTTISGAASVLQLRFKPTPPAYLVGDLVACHYLGHQFAWLS
jgi:hypothetical protein